MRRLRKMKMRKMKLKSILVLGSSLIFLQGSVVYGADIQNAGVQNEAPSEQHSNLMRSMIIDQSAVQRGEPSFESFKDLFINDMMYLIPNIHSKVFQVALLKSESLEVKDLVIARIQRLQQDYESYCQEGFQELAQKAIADIAEYFLGRGHREGFRYVFTWTNGYGHDIATALLAMIKQEGKEHPYSSLVNRVRAIAYDNQWKETPIIGSVVTYFCGPNPFKSFNGSIETLPGILINKEHLSCKIIAQENLTDDFVWRVEMSSYGDERESVMRFHLSLSHYLYEMKRRGVEIIKEILGAAEKLQKQAPKFAKTLLDLLEGQELSPNQQYWRNGIYCENVKGVLDKNTLNILKQYVWGETEKALTRDMLLRKIQISSRSHILSPQLILPMNDDWQSGLKVFLGADKNNSLAGELLSKDERLSRLLGMVDASYYADEGVDSERDQRLKVNWDTPMQQARRVQNDIQTFLDSTQDPRLWTSPATMEQFENIAWMFENKAALRSGQTTKLKLEKGIARDLSKVNKDFIDKYQDGFQGENLREYRAFFKELLSGANDFLSKKYQWAIHLEDVLNDGDKKLYGDLTRDLHVLETFARPSNADEFSMAVVANRDCSEIYVLVAGTKSIDDWTGVNFQYYRDKESDRFSVHEGFFQTVHGYREDLKAALKRVYSAAKENGKKPIIYSMGHSLGGAVATVVGLLIDDWSRSGSFPEELSKGQLRILGPAAAMPLVGDENVRGRIERIGPENMFYIDSYHDLVPWITTYAGYSRNGIGTHLILPTSFFRRAIYGESVALGHHTMPNYKQNASELIKAVNLLVEANRGEKSQALESLEIVDTYVKTGNEDSQKLFTTIAVAGGFFSNVGWGLGQIIWSPVTVTQAASSWWWPGSLGGEKEE